MLDRLIPWIFLACAGLAAIVLSSAEISIMLGAALFLPIVIGMFMGTMFWMVAISLIVQRFPRFLREPRFSIRDQATPG